jgi:hypothetical protein
MAPIMFKFNRAYQTLEQQSLAIKSTEANKHPQTCAMKYSFNAKMQSHTHSKGGSMLRRSLNYTKVKNIYLNNKLIGKQYCIPS